MELIEQVERLKKERDALILAHYYVDAEVQKIADFVGDSYYLSKKAMACPQKVIVFCGVRFMGESAKLMNPEKTIVMPDASADCPMAHMATMAEIDLVKKEHPAAAVVCYINSTAEIKALSDVCVTSSNAVRVIRALPNQEIYFIPDQNLARYISMQIPEKTFLLGTGYCHVHHGILPELVTRARQDHPGAEFLAHPECCSQVLSQADFVGSTSEIIDYARQSGGKEFLIGTETGVFYQLQKENPHKRFYPVHANQICPNMKKISLEKVVQALETLSPTVELLDDWMKQALPPLKRMHEIAK